MRILLPTKPPKEKTTYENHAMLELNLGNWVTPVTSQHVASSLELYESKGSTEAGGRWTHPQG